MADDDLCQLEISLGGYRVSLRELIKLQGEGEIVLKIPEKLEVDLRFLSISFGSGVGVIEGDDLVITLKKKVCQHSVTDPMTQEQRENRDRKSLFFELEEIYRKLSFRRDDK